MSDIASGRVLAERSEDIGRGHAEILIPMINDCLADCGLEYADLEKVAVTCGPGSFTGVRVGVSTARGFGLSLGIPVTGISTLDAVEFIARKKLPTGPLATILDARRDEVYCKISGRENNKAPSVMRHEELADELRGVEMNLCGSGAELINAFLEEPFRVVNDMDAAPVSLITEFVSGATYTELPPEPLYLRPPDAKPQSGFTLPRAS